MMRKVFLNKQLIFIGDTHNLNLVPIFSKQFTNNEIQNAVFICCGDCGEGFSHPLREQSYLRKLYNYLTKINSFIIIVRGNHSDPSFFYDSHWTNKQFNHRIYFAPDYSVFTVNNKKIQCVGGGISVDRSDRIVNRTWWENEEVVYSPEKIEKVDVFVSHISPTNFPLTKAATNDLCKHFHGVEAMFGGDLIGELNHESLLIQNLSDLSGAKVHVFGHLHTDHFYYDSVNDKKYYLLGINSFKEINL